ncbi:Spa2 homology (SHD) of GIT [Penicillium riverlandense]|uniref:Spa2 homology (SHD) of GIT n=1 Tax=Penicillium riverlandense TaxID=1903569 RepID=UPI0025465D4F|nr:Spa2 homology (SHD) of GIT [Penicillium riverlandense]KAJ5808165.1 Spa2 homology (SHD) of GIT [Penicillium riverlandense]
MSPVSVDGSDWSGINQYQKTEPPFSPTFSARGNLATPPTSQGIPSAPLSPSIPPPTGSANPSPPSSIAARSSVGTLGDGQRDPRRYRQMEEILGQHYAALKRFLNASYRDDRGPGRSNKARDKLLRLSPTQFHELSTDVYDELVRRQQAMPPPGRPPRPDVPPFLPPRKEFHEKRNQARQKLASLQHQRFRDLATDVYCELERRFPHFTGQNFRGRPGGPPGGDAPFARSFQSNTMVPNKSTMVEDSDDMGMDDDDDARSDAFALDAVLSRRGTTTTIGESERRLLADSQAQVSALQEKIDKLEEMVRSKDEELARSQDASQSEASKEREEWDELRLDLEAKMAQAEDRNSSLQLELERVRAEHDVMERDLRTQIEDAARGTEDAALATRYADLEIKHDSLQAELQHQRKVTEEVRQQASTFLMEMKTLSEQSHATWEREEQLSGQVHRLEDEVNEWKHRYAKAKAQLRHVRATSGGIADSRPDASVLVKEHELVQVDGLIRDVHVTKFQMSVDELLRVARFEESRVVVHQIKLVIVAVRHILQDVDQGPLPVDGSAALRTRAKNRVATTTNNMITAARNFASSSGLSPVSLLDAAASHLAIAIVELIRAVKIQASPATELEDDEAEVAQMNGQGYFETPASQRRYSNGSEYSAMSPPDHSHISSIQNGIINGYGAAQEDHEVQELKLYVEDQTDGLVQSIQSLVASIRAEDGLTTVQTHVSAISDVVANVVSSTEHLVHERSSDKALRERAEPIVQVLDECRARLEGTAADGPDAINKLPPIAFEIARQTKELVHRLDTAANGYDDEDFR